MTRNKLRHARPRTTFLSRRVDTCEKCDAPLRWRVSTAAKPHGLPDYGFRLDIVGLANATCTRCRTSHAIVTSPTKLRDAVMEQILLRPGPLSADEIRYLRKQLGLTGGIFAGLVGVSREHVSHIEQGHAPNLGTAADRLARLVIASRLDPSLGLLKRMLKSLDENIGTRSRRKEVRHRGYKVKVGARG